MAHTRTDSDEGRRSSWTASLVRGYKVPILAALALAIAVAVVWFVPLSNPASGGGDSASANHTSIIARAKGDAIPIYDEPGDRKRAMTMSGYTDVGAPRVFLVVGAEKNGWLNVLLPVRPNGTQGWIRAREVALTKTTYRVHVYLSEHRIVVKHGQDEVVVEGPIAVGTNKTPTPGGAYYIISLLETPKENSAYGPYAFGLSGFSGVLETFNGGPARIGLHGTQKPELLGQDVSHGCIRMSNDNIRELAHKLPLGTPVYIHA